MTGRASDAAARLGVPAGAGAAEVRAAFLHRLGEADFLPPPACLAAYEALAGRRLAEPRGEEEDDEADREPELRDEVEQFAAGFFALPVAGRRRRWHELALACADRPRLAARLRRLARGLEVEAASAAGPPDPAARLAGHVRELFVLRPAERAAWRRRLLATFDEDPAYWCGAARELKARDLETAALVPDLIERALEGPARRKLLARLRRRRKARRVVQRVQRFCLTPSLTATLAIVLISLAFAGLLLVLVGMHAVPPPAGGRPAAPPRFLR